MLGINSFELNSSTRIFHPIQLSNFDSDNLRVCRPFGEITQWWALWILSIVLNYFYIALLSPLLITFLIVYVSGIPMLEKRYQNNKKYLAYKNRTPILIPFIKKRTD